MENRLTFEDTLLKNVFFGFPCALMAIKDNVIKEVNKITAKELEYDDSSELIGLNPGFFAPLFQLDGKDSEKSAIEHCAIALEKGNHEFEFLHRTKSGTKLWFKVVLKKFDQNSDVLIAILTNITESKMIEDRYNRFMSCFPGAIYIKNENLKYVYSNREARKIITGNVNGDLEDKVITETQGILSKKNIEIVADYDKLLLKNGRNVEFELHIEETENSPKKWLRVYKFLYESINNEKYLAGIAVDISEIAKSRENTRDVLESLITTIGAITEFRDPYTFGHENRVASLAIEIGKEMNFSEKRLEIVRFSSLLHDVGKIQIPLEILTKPGSLSDSQESLVKEHPQVGYDIIKQIQFEQPIAEVVKQHHEKCDGSGYPEGLMCDEIKLEAKIICVADVFEAMSNHRPYRPGLPLEECIKELQDNSGTLYDQNVVDICVDIIRNGTSKLDGWNTSIFTKKM
ncbi:Cyclic di-GMP phosphodiesterase response regulator RpfG [Candidatus Izimaplasma bacterium HR1]|jgi:putative nucleotidyltransferase with HDIG domain|uniref:HD domain-containing phosphohydrolase n=1 Tax=Candidatus Izimoplasma sp. HR1 TaxID=1541959 RepID=UPI0004F602E2|nr:Cyclic di-GMP phosphodiesterase response regulator RpfG [Candidatus Izimaplasma bacterium HR1]